MTGPRRILVTGPGGYIGRAAVGVLAAQGHEIVALVREGTNRLAVKPAPDGVRILELPPLHLWKDHQELAEVAADADVALHLAWASQFRGVCDSENQERARWDVEFSQRVADLCQETGIGQLIFASSAGAVYGGPVPERGYAETSTATSNDAYGKAKLTVEQDFLERFECRTSSGGCAHILRISTPFGPGVRRNRSTGAINNFVEAALAGRPLEIFGGGVARRDFVYIHDLVEMIARFVSALPDRSSIWNIGANQTASVNEVVDIIENVMGRPLQRRHSDACAGPQSIKLDVSKFHNAFQFSPRYTIRGGIEDLIESMTASR